MKLTDEENILKLVGEQIFCMRKKAGMLQIDLAKKVGLSRTSISNIEQGRHEINITTLCKIADALECTVGQLLPYKFQSLKYSVAQFVKQT